MLSEIIVAVPCPLRRRPLRQTRARGVLLTAALLLVCVARAAAAGQEAPEPGRTDVVKRARAVRIARGQITLDGKLTEDACSLASPADGFVQQQPREGSPASHASAVRFLFDDEYLYIGASFSEDEPHKLVTNELRRDFSARDGDLYVVVLDTFHDQLNAYNFQTNPGCALRDSQSYDDGRTINANWDTVWFCRSSIDGHTWFVEEAIPFKQLRFPAHDDQVWGLQLFRLIRHRNEPTMWNPTPRQFNQFKTSYAGVLEGISGVRPGRNIRFKPFATGQRSRRGGVRSQSADGGFDVKIGVGTSLVLDGTYRTDFSQVEADAQQVNLTRFNLFFPEKREFFLENQGAFQIGPPATDTSNLVPFFSRRIGLSEAGSPIPVVAGARLTGKVGRNSLALLNIQTEAEVRATAAPLPPANFSVVRYGREFLANSSAGVFFLGKQQGSVSNRLVGSDLRWYPTRRINIDGMFLHSEKTAAGGGTAWRLGSQYDSGLTQYTANYTSLGESFRDDLGFIPRQGVDITSASVMRRVRIRALAPLIREIRPQLPYARYWRGGLRDAAGRRVGVETATLSPAITAEFGDASTLELSVVNDEEALTSPFRPQGIPAGTAIAAGRYRFTAGTLTYTGSNARRLSFQGAVRRGEYYSGRRHGLTAGGRLRVGEKLASTISVARDRITLPAGVAFDTTLASLRVDASFSTRMFLNAFIQYNSVTRQVSSNIRYDFIHHPLSDIYLVFNDTHDVDIARPALAPAPGRAVVLKVTHLLSF